MRRNVRKNSAIYHLLLALVPYTTQNLKLVFYPNQFFNDLENASGKSLVSLHVAYSRARKKGLVHVSQNGVSLSLEARQSIQPFVAQKLTSGGQLMVIFDIPETISNRRQELRYLLKQLSFKNIQQSVWMSDTDHKDVLSETIVALGLQEYVQLYEAARIK